MTYISRLVDGRSIRHFVSSDEASSRLTCLGVEKRRKEVEVPIHTPILRLHRSTVYLPDRAFLLRGM